jgi:hypothetical protein
MFGRRPLRCSFCGKDATQVSKLAAGPKVYICDACVATARHIMDISKDGGDLTPRASLPYWRRLVARFLRFASFGNAQRRVDAGALQRPV